MKLFKTLVADLNETNNCEIRTMLARTPDQNLMKCDGFPVAIFITVMSFLAVKLLVKIKTQYNFFFHFTYKSLHHLVYKQ